MQHEATGPRAAGFGCPQQGNGRGTWPNLFGHVANSLAPGDMPTQARAWHPILLNRDFLAVRPHGTSYRSGGWRVTRTRTGMFGPPLQPNVAGGSPAGKNTPRGVFRGAPRPPR